MDEETSRREHTLLGTDDAMTWATEFCRIFDGKTVASEETPLTTVDPGLMVGWFANAMQVAVNLHAERTASEAIQLPEGWEDDQFRSESDDIIDLVEALQRDEEEARAREDKFIEGFYDGRNDHIDPYGDTP